MYCPFKRIVLKMTCGLQAYPYSVLEISISLRSSPADVKRISN